jgi:hypothetical protein
MSDNDSSKADDAAASAMAATFALFTSALSHNWSQLMAMPGFPQVSDGAGEAPLDGTNFPNLAGMPLQAMAPAWKMFNDAMRWTSDFAAMGEGGAADRASRSMAAAFQAWTGLNPSDLLAGAGRDWSPKQVAFRSFGFGDNDALAFSAEFVRLATASSENARATMTLYRILSEAWLKAAQDFAGRRRVPDVAPDIVELQRNWAETAEPVLQDALRSEAFVNAQADFIRTGASQAKARTVFAKRFTDFIEAPSRQEMNEAYEAIQDLRREVRELRRQQKRFEAARDLIPSAPEAEPKGV